MPQKAKLKRNPTSAIAQVAEVAICTYKVRFDHFCKITILK